MNVIEYGRGNVNGQSRETGKIWYTRRRQTIHRHNTTCVGHHYPQTNTNNENKTWPSYNINDIPRDILPMFPMAYYIFIYTMTTIFYILS
jgi:hypothetical protein